MVKKISDNWANMVKGCLSLACLDHTIERSVLKLWNDAQVKKSFEKGKKVVTFFKSFTGMISSFFWGINWFGYDALLGSWAWFNHDYFVYNLTVKILTNSHNLIRNPLHWPICLIWKCIPHRVKVLRDCTYSIPFFPLNLIPIRGCLVFVRYTLLSRRVRCDRCGTLLCSTACVRQCPMCALLWDTVTVPYALLPWHHCHRPLSLFFCVFLMEQQNFNNFFWLVGRMVTVIQVREVHRILGQGDTRFLFC